MTQEATQPNTWVGIDVAAIALGVSETRAAIIAREERWTTRPGSRPRQYLFDDIRRTHRQRSDRS